MSEENVSFTEKAIDSIRAHFSWTKLAVFVTGEGIGMPLTIAGGEGFASGQYHEAMVGYGFGLPLVAIGFSFPFFEHRLASGLRDWIAKAARILAPMAIVAASVYVLGPNIYRRATTPLPLAAVSTSFNVLENQNGAMPVSGPTIYKYKNQMNIQNSLETTRMLGLYFDAISPITMVITAPSDNEAFKDDFYSIIVAACHMSPTTRCLVEPVPDPKLDVDSDIPDPEYSGIVIHHKSLGPNDVTINNIVRVFGCFKIKMGAHIPNGISQLNVDHLQNFYWFELGHGSPWNPDRECE